jgi:hypothetical protein
MSSTWSGPRHGHEHSILIIFPVEISGKVVSRADYRECACGHRVPAAVTEVPVRPDRRHSNPGHLWPV